MRPCVPETMEVSVTKGEGIKRSIVERYRLPHLPHAIPAGNPTAFGDGQLGPLLRKLHPAIPVALDRTTRGLVTAGRRFLVKLLSRRGLLGVV